MVQFLLDSGANKDDQDEVSSSRDGVPRYWEETTLGSSA